MNERPEPATRSLTVCETQTSEGPAVDVHVGPWGAAAVGAGAVARGLKAAAIANALFDALHVRVRDLPLTAERIVAAMA